MPSKMPGDRVLKSLKSSFLFHRRETEGAWREKKTRDRPDIIIGGGAVRLLAHSTIDTWQVYLFPTLSKLTSTANRTSTNSTLHVYTLDMCTLHVHTPYIHSMYTLVDVYTSTIGCIR